MIWFKRDGCKEVGQDSFFNKKKKKVEEKIKVEGVN